MLMFGTAAGPVKNKAELRTSALSSPNECSDCTMSHGELALHPRFYPEKL